MERKIHYLTDAYCELYGSHKACPDGRLFTDGHRAIGEEVLCGNIKHIHPLNFTSIQSHVTCKVCLLYLELANTVQLTDGSFTALPVDELSESGIKIERLNTMRNSQVEKVVLKIIAREKEKYIIRKKNVSDAISSELFDLIEKAGYESDMCDIVLDLLGVPEDNTLEYKLEDYQDTMPDGMFCRDYLDDRWRSMIQKTKSDPQKFIRLCLRAAKTSASKSYLARPNTYIIIPSWIAIKSETNPESEGDISDKWTAEVCPMGENNFMFRVVTEKQSAEEHLISEQMNRPNDWFVLATFKTSNEARSLCDEFEKVFNARTAAQAAKGAGVESETTKG